MAAHTGDVYGELRALGYSEDAIARVEEIGHQIGRQREHARCATHVRLARASGADRVAAAAMREGRSVADVADQYITEARTPLHANAAAHVLRALGVEIGGRR